MRIEPLTKPPDKTVRVPGSKSYTNRALVCALLAEGRSVITGALVSDDTQAMATAIEALGARVQWDGTTVTVDGTGGRLPDTADLHVNQAGTAARFLAPVLATGRGTYRLDGDEQLRRRPMGPLIEALRSLGVEVREEGEPGHLPITVKGIGRVPDQPVEVAADVSSQFVSGLLLAGFDVRPSGPVVSAPYIRMTEHVRDTFGPTFAVEPDATAASYFYAAGALFDGGRVRVEGLTEQSRQGDVDFVHDLEAMNATVTADEQGIEVRGTSTPEGNSFDLRDRPDVAQTLAAVAAFAEGTTTVTGIGFVRHHETDRIKAVVTELQRCGIEATENDDGFTIVGGNPKPATVQTYGDHRMAMSFALIGLKVGIELDDPGCVAKTFPDYFDVLESLRQ
ncbi:MAG TPA: 3-phosphoshikimate 1-carboxyvinyltransferase [Acidimicrobiales bacterium]|nr:3-phosphoshikimate 1-carboxyvinyltransferase [Acidimicrobiales bacterium]